MSDLLAAYGPNEAQEAAPPLVQPAEASPLIYRTDQNDEADGLPGATDNDADHVVIRSNGTGDVAVQAQEGSQPSAVTACQPGCSE